MPSSLRVDLGRGGDLHGRSRAGARPPRQPRARSARARLHGRSRRRCTPAPTRGSTGARARRLRAGGASTPSRRGCAPPPRGRRSLRTRRATAGRGRAPRTRSPRIAASWARPPSDRRRLLRRRRVCRWISSAREYLACAVSTSPASVDDPVEGRGEALGPGEPAVAARARRASPRHVRAPPRGRVRAARSPRGTRRRSARDRRRAPSRCDTPRTARPSPARVRPSIHDARPAVISAPDATERRGARRVGVEERGGVLARREVLAADVPVHAEVAAQLQAGLAGVGVAVAAPRRGACRARLGDCPPRRCRARARSI